MEGAAHVRWLAVAMGREARVPFGRDDEPGEHVE